MRSEKVDRSQLKALLKAQIKIDLRGTTNPLSQMASKKNLRFPPFLTVLLFFFFMGLPSTAIIAVINSPFLGQLLLFTMVMVFSSITILLDYSDLILSPDDFAIIAPHPVSSRTFFLAKLLNVVIYVSMLAVAFGVAPSVANAIRFDNIVLFPVTLIAICSAALFSSLFLVTFYTLMLRISSREKMKQALSYLQLIFIFFMYVALILSPQLMKPMGTMDMTMYESNWYYLLPSAWYSSWVLILIDVAKPIDFVACLAGLVVIAAFYLASQSRLSLDYARSLADSTDKVGSVGITKRKVGILYNLWKRYTTPEDKAVWKLIATQFKHDNRFKVSVLILIPLVVIYLLLGISKGETLIDPFMIGETAGGSGNILIYVAIAILPAMAIMNTSYSSSYHAAWIFFTAPSERARFAIANKRFALFFFCLPYLLLLFVIFAYFFGNVLHAFLHTMTLLFLCLIILNLLTILTPRIPFSKPYEAGRQMSNWIVAFPVAIVLVMVPMMIIVNVGYGGPLTYGIIQFALLAIALLLLPVQKKVFHKRLESLEFLEG